MCLSRGIDQCHILAQTVVQMAVHVDTLVVGAGIAGLSAARKMAASGERVLVVDKGRGVGGRMATRRFSGAVFDHGAQSFTVIDPRFRAIVYPAISNGAAVEWYVDHHIHYRGVDGITSPVKELTTKLNVWIATKVDRIVCREGGWVSSAPDRDSIYADKLILTPPVPQSLEILSGIDLGLPNQLLDDLRTVEYERCIAALIILDEPPGISEPGFIRNETGTIRLIVDNVVKQISRIPSYTVHASPEFSLENWDRSDAEILSDLLDAEPSLRPSSVIDFQIHRWRYARPVRTIQARTIVSEKPARIAFAGDAFGTGNSNIETAALSGLAAAEALLKK